MIQSSNWTAAPAAAAQRYAGAVTPLPLERFQLRKGLVGGIGALVDDPAVELIDHAIEAPAVEQCHAVLASAVAPVGVPGVVAHAHDVAVLGPERFHRRFGDIGVAHIGGIGVIGLP